MAYVIKYQEVKIDNKGRVLLPKDLREYLKAEGVEKVWFEQDTENNTNQLKWKRPKKKDIFDQQKRDF